MPFVRPTLTELNDRIAADVSSRLPGADALLRRSFVGTLARAQAGAAHGLHGFLRFAADQVFPDSAEAEFLDRWGAIWGVVRKPPQAATAPITITGTDAAVIPAGSLLARGDGVEYATDGEVTIVAGTASATVTASIAGADGNAATATSVSFVSPIVGVDGTAAMTGDGATGGNDLETDASLRGRVLARIQAPPHGGAGHDYHAWALSKEDHGIDVTRAWVADREMGPGSATVRFMMDTTYADGLPLQADVDAVAAFVETVRPVTAEVHVVAPIAVPVTFRISGLNPATSAVKDAIEAELKDLILREATPGGTILVTHIREAISLAAGEHDHRLLAPVQDIVSSLGRITTFAGIDWL